MAKKRKNWSAYRASYGKMAAIRYFFDRTYIYSFIAIFVVATIGVGFYVKGGLDSLDRIVADPEINSPYQNIEMANSTGKNWAMELIKKKPTNVQKWETTDSSKPQHAIDPKTCGSIKDIPTSLLSTYTGLGSGTETRIQTYGAGQAAKNFNAYTTAISDCQQVETASDKISAVSKFESGFIMTMGDAIIGVKTTNNTERDNILKFYMDEAEKSLKASKCLALNVTEKDSSRSFFYDPKSYTGLTKDKELSTQVSIKELPVPTSIKLKNLEETTVTEPEAPLPDGFPKLPKDEEKPTLPSDVENKTAFDGKAIYQIADENGPGCGWGWSAQAAPIYDQAKLKKAEETSIIKKQNELNDQAQKYVDSKLQWSFNMALMAPAVDNWNNYVNKINNVHEKWDWLTKEREKIKTDWYNYVSAHNDWSSFDGRKDDASKKYDESLKQCKAKQDELSAWEEKWGEIYDEQKKAELLPTPEPTENKEEGTDEEVTPSPTPTPEQTEKPKVDIPEKPAGCTVLPEKPAILDQTKPAEPQAPKIGSGVTIPQSWPQPNS